MSLDDPNIDNAQSAIFLSEYLLDLNEGAGFLNSLSPEDHPHTIEHVQQHQRGETGSSFELVLDFILDGIRGLNESGVAPD